MLVGTAALPPAAAQAQPVSSGVVRGIISTQQTTPLPGVDVKVIDPTGRIVAVVFSDSEGRFQINSLTAGTHRVMAALDGFETTTVSVVVTHEGAEFITVDLPIARFADTIDVGRRDHHGVERPDAGACRGHRKPRTRPIRTGGRAFRAPCACSRPSSLWRVA